MIILSGILASKIAKNFRMEVLNMLAVSLTPYICKGIEMKNIKKLVQYFFAAVSLVVFIGLGASCETPPPAPPAGFSGRVFDETIPEEEMATFVIEQFGVSSVNGRRFIVRAFSGRIVTWYADTYRVPSGQRTFIFDFIYNESNEFKNQIITANFEAGRTYTLTLRESNPTQMRYGMGGSIIFGLSEGGQFIALPRSR